MSKQHSIQKEQFLSFTPSLACHVGVEAAIVLQKIAWLCSCPNTGRVIDGERWVWNTLSDWQRNFFPFWSVRTIQRIFDGLETAGVLVTCQPQGSDRTVHYRISEGMYEKLTIEALDSLPKPCGQSVHMDVANLSTCYKAASTTESRVQRAGGQKGSAGLKRGFSDSNPRPYPKTEEEMYQTLESEGVEAVPEKDGGFFDQKAKALWRIKGKPIADWVAVYRSLLKKTTRLPSKRNQGASAANGGRRSFSIG